MRRWVLLIGFTLVALAAVPFAFIARARTSRTPSARYHVLPDMDHQPRFKPQTSSPLFADGRAMRPRVPGTIARGGLREDAHLHRGVTGNEWASTFPLPVDASLLSRGREKFEIFCTPCHGASGYGDGIVAVRAEGLQEGSWVPPSSFHTDLVRSRPVGHLYNTVTHGIRSMPGYGPQIETDDRWAVVAYVRALQRSQNARLEDVPDDFRPGLGVISEEADEDR